MRIAMRFARIALALAILPVSGAALASLGSGKLPKIGTQTEVRSVQLNTATFRPQVRKTIQIPFSRPENPIPPIQPGRENEENTIPVGSATLPTQTQVSLRRPGITFTGWNPPDPNLGVGPRQIVQIVNCSVGFIDKTSGAITFQQVINGPQGFFASVGAGDFVFDPKATYDPNTRRFYILALDVNFTAQTSHFVVGVSDDSDPAGNWNLYRFEARFDQGGNAFWMDYPSLGFNKDALVVCGNMFGFTSGFAGVQVHVIPKAPLLAGRPASQTIFADRTSGSGQFARTTDPTLGTVYGMSVRSTTSMRLYAVTNPGSSTAALQFNDVAIPTFVPASRDAQSAGGRQLDTIDSRVFNVKWLGGRLVAAHTVQVSGSDNRPASRWYEFATSNWPVAGSPSLIQAGDIVGDNGSDAFMPAVGINRFGDITVIYTRSSANIVADVMVASRRRSDRLGFMGVPRRLDGSPSPYGGATGVNRWGDYFDVTTDPADNATFWGTAMVGDASGAWVSTYYRWTVTNPALAGLLAPIASARTTVGRTNNGTISDLTGLNDGREYSITSVLTSTVGQAAGIEARFTAPAAQNRIQSLSWRVSGLATRPVTQMVWIYNHVRQRFELLDQVTQSTAAQVRSGTLEIGSPYVGADRSIRLQIRANAPNRSGVPQPAFGYRIDFAEIRVVAQ